MKLRSRTTILVLLLSLIPLWCQAATLTSSVNRNPIKINQTLTLKVQYDERVAGSELDLSELAKDFEVLAVVPNSNSSVSIINGQTTRQSTTTWTITLAAKREGVLQIPAFDVNGDKSSPINIQVSSLTAEELAQPQPIEVSVTIDDSDNLSIKPGEQIIVNVELSAATNVNDIRGEEFKVEGAAIEALGQQNGQRIENGVARLGAVWRYALYPTAEGTITIPAQTFTGTVGGTRSFFDSFNRGGEQVRGQSVEQTIIVAAKPAANGRSWFPADNVTIESTWAGDVSQIKVGEPITRSITVTATGQRARVIPPLVVQNTNEYKSYRDQPQLEDSTTAQGIVGTRTESEAIVPSIDGELTLPEQRISWWDNQSDQWQEAILPAETLTVLAAANTTGNGQQGTQIDRGNPSNLNLGSRSEGQFPGGQTSSHWLWKLATICLGIICLLQFYLLSKRTSQPVPASATTNKQQTENTAWKELQNSLKGSDANLIRQRLLAWSQAALPEQSITSLTSLSQLSNSNELRTQINCLDKHIYSNGESINVEKLASVLSAFRQELKTISKNQASRNNELAPLYPA